jgi:hypothetical protein
MIIITSFYALSSILIIILPRRVENDNNNVLAALETSAAEAPLRELLRKSGRVIDVRPHGAAFFADKKQCLLPDQQRLAARSRTSPWPTVARAAIARARGLSALALPESPLP